MVFRRRRRSMGMVRPNTIRSYKKILDFAPASHAGSTKVEFIMSTGFDSVSPGQGSVTDNTVPTGSIITEFIIQYSVINLVETAMFNWWNIQLLRSGQTKVNPRVTGGNPQRNQVMRQSLRSVGQNQNRDYSFVYKIPRKYQRVREGDVWVFVSECDQTNTDCCKVIYKLTT